MKKQAMNPFHPSWEYIPDGEPHVFGDRVYVYGSHDRAHGYVFCQNDYVCWSAPVNDLSDWRYEGIIFPKTADPLNKDGRMCLYAPDVTQGPDGRYYIYYVYDKVCIVSVAVCDTPAGQYEFLGYVKYKDGTILGKREGDLPQFDPGVLTEGKTTYLYTGFCGHEDESRLGAMAMSLEEDMLTIKDEPKIIVPGNCYGKGTSFEGFEYFEAASIRKIGDTYYFIYSATPMHVLCYATSRNPLDNFTYGGAIVCNCDIGIDSYKPADKPMNIPSLNNHGSIEQINGKWYVFYHRHTNGSWFSRQGCIEPIEVLPNGSISQVEVTSQGANCKPLAGVGEYPAYIACHIFSTGDEQPPIHLMPKITQDAVDTQPLSSGEDFFSKGEDTSFVTNITSGTGIGFKYFDCKGVSKITVTTRGYNTGTIEVRLRWDGEAVGEIPIVSSNVWEKFSADIDIPDGVHAFYFVYNGSNGATIKSFELR